MTIIANLRAQRNLLRQLRTEIFENIAALLEAYPFEFSQGEGMAVGGGEGGESEAYAQIEVLYGRLESLGRDIMEIHGAISGLLKDGMGKKKKGEGRVGRSG